LAQFSLDLVWIEASAAGQCGDSRIRQQFGGVLDSGPSQEFAATRLREQQLDFTAQFGIGLG
jgi:hypothetical protein